MIALCVCLQYSDNRSGSNGSSDWESEHTLYMPVPHNLYARKLHGLQYCKVDRILVFLSACWVLTIYIPEMGLVTPNFYFIFWYT